jgi:hypothetical protein
MRRNKTKHCTLVDIEFPTISFLDPWSRSCLPEYGRRGKRDPTDLRVMNQLAGSLFVPYPDTEHFPVIVTLPSCIRQLSSWARNLHWVEQQKGIMFFLRWRHRETGRLGFCGVPVVKWKFAVNCYLAVKSMHAILLDLRYFQLTLREVIIVIAHQCAQEVGILPISSIVGGPEVDLGWLVPTWRMLKVQKASTWREQPGTNLYM